MVCIDDFKKLELKVVRIKDAKNHPNADKLYLLTLETGEGERQVVAGIRNFYTPEELIGKKVVAITNMQAAVIRGSESQGMVLAASDGTVLTLLAPEKDIPVGTKIS